MIARLILVLFPILACGAACQPQPPVKSEQPSPSAAAQAAAGPRGDRHALLIGVTFYENLPSAKHLIGPGNDVMLMRKLLIDKFQFSPTQIVTLSEAEGKARGKDFYPTRANIEREFKRLAKVAKPKEQVVIHMGGHGSQQPEDKSQPEPEPDGLDEIFLPRDVGAWDGSKGTVRNAVVDNDMALWLKAIRDTKASVWITFDSCHSGGMIRGGDDSEKARDLNPVDDLGIPKKAIKEAQDFAAAREAKKPEAARGGSEPAPPFKLAQEGGIVAIYACQPNEVTYERDLPGGPDAKIHGLLTFAMCKVLTEAAAKSVEPITYNELARRILAQYIQWGRNTPTPLIEGIDRDRQVLGDKVWPGRSSIVLKAEPGGMKINAGALQGLTPGSVLAVYPPPGQGNLLIGHVRVTEDMRTLDAMVEPCAFNKLPAVKALPDGGACKVVFADVGDQQLRVAVDPADDGGKPIPAAKLKQLTEQVAGLGGKDSTIKPVAKTHQADWLVRLRGKEVVLVRGAAASTGNNTAVGPAPLDDQLGTWLQENAAGIARAESLVRLAAGNAAVGDRQVRIDAKVYRCKNAADTNGTIAVDWAPNVKAFDADRFRLKLTNTGRVPADVTVLFVDSGFGIKCLYPRDGNINRLRPGDAPEVIPLKINTETSGVEHLVIITVKGQGQPVDFCQLEQPTLALARGAAGGQEALDTPLGKLLQRGMYGTGSSRGATADEVEDYSMLVIPLNVVPQKRPAK
jgi:hypothetical protein